MTLRTLYGWDLGHIRENRTLPVDELADVVMWLPAGCPFWRSFGGPAAKADDIRALEHIDYHVQVLAWMQSKGASSSNKPKLPKDPPYAHERDRDADVGRKRFESMKRREARRRAIT